MNAQDIKALVFGTHSPDYRRPASAFVIQKQLGLSTEAAFFDISLGCSSAVDGLQVVASTMANSDIDKAILVLADTTSKTTNPNDRASIMLIGEAGVAVYLEKTKENTVPIMSLMRSDGAGYRYLSCLRVATGTCTRTMRILKTRNYFIFKMIKIVIF